MSDARIAFAFVARRQGRRAMQESEWVHILSLELGWMSPAQARGYVAAALAGAVLAAEDGGLALTFDPNSIDVPRGFRPAPALSSEENGETSQAVPATDPDDLFLIWLGKLGAATGEQRDAVLARVATVQERMGGMITAEAALLWLARDAGLDVRSAARDVEAGLRVT